MQFAVTRNHKQPIPPDSQIPAKMNKTALLALALIALMAVAQGRFMATFQCSTARMRVR